MSNIEKFLNSIYADNTNKMIYFYLALVAITAVLIVIIIIVSLVSSKKKNKDKKIKKEEPKASELIQEKKITEENTPIVEIEPIIEPINDAKSIEPVIKPVNDIKSSEEIKAMIESIKEANYSPVYLDRKEVKIEPPKQETALKSEIEPDIMNYIGKAAVFSQNPVNELAIEPEVTEKPEPISEKPEVNIEQAVPEELNIFEPEHEEKQFGISELDLNVPAFFNMNPIEPEVKPDAQNDQEVVLSAEDLRAKLAKLQIKSQPSTENELENILKQVGINDEEREIPNLANEEDIILGR